MCDVVRRKLTDDRIDSDNVIVYPDELADYVRGTLKTFIVTDWRDQELERYYGNGLRRLMDSAKKFKENPWCLATRHYKPNKN